MFNTQEQLLNNGLRLITVPMPALKSITAMILVNTGSRFEEQDCFGIAHLLEHVVFKGTKQYPRSQDFSIALDEIGANSNAFTSKETTGYYVTSASNQLFKSLNLLKELLFYPLLRTEDIEQEKLVIAEEIKMYHDSPEDFIAEEFEQLVFDNLGLAHPISGSIESVMSISQTKIKQFLQKWYGLPNMVLVLAGDEQVLKQANLEEKVTKVFARQKPEKTQLYSQQRQEFLSKKVYSAKDKVIHKRPSLQQAHVVLGWPALKRNDPQRYVLNVFATVMGGNRSSRLFEVVRERSSLAYYIYADVAQYYDGGFLEVSVGLNSQKLKQGTELIVNEFVKVAEAKEPITAQELKRAQTYLEGKILLSLENSRLVAQQYGLSKLLLDKIEEPDEIVKKIKEVSLPQLQALATRLIQKEQLRLAVISDCAK